MLEWPATKGFVDVLAVLVRHGADVNFAPVTPHVSRPIWAAVLHNRSEAVRWLLDHGAEVNYAEAEGEEVHCKPLSTAIRHGFADIVRMLVEAAAKLDALDNCDLTPLSWALGSGNAEIADYLRSKGGVEPCDAPGYAARMESRRLPPVPTWFRENFGDVSPVISAFAGSPVTLYGFCGSDSYGLVTVGLSNHEMNVPEGGDEAYRRAEVLLYLDGWSTDVASYTEPEHLWVLDWIARVAAYPIANGTWLGGKWTIISNEDPPRPLSEFTAMTCWLLLAEKEPLVRCDLPDGRSVVFYTLMAIHTAERDLAQRDGLVALLEKFAEHDVGVHLDPNRPSVV